MQAHRRSGHLSARRHSSARLKPCRMSEPGRCELEFHRASGRWRVRWRPGEMRSRRKMRRSLRGGELRRRSHSVPGGVGLRMRARHFRPKEGSLRRRMVRGWVRCSGLRAGGIARRHVQRHRLGKRHFPPHSVGSDRLEARDQAGGVLHVENVLGRSVVFRALRIVHVAILPFRITCRPAARSQFVVTVRAALCVFRAGGVRDCDRRMEV